MRIALAEKLLISLMNWSTEQIREERPLLQALSNLKYDDYQQFSQGTRFIESLVIWLEQFEENERIVAYDFLKRNLIFFSNDQMLHLVNITFTEKINPKLIELSAETLKVKPFELSKIVNSKIYKDNLRKSLFIGLSDGSRMDQLRRSSNLNNEQVLPIYSISEDKAKDVLEDLRKTRPKSFFNSIFLFDDFTASGTSYFRFEEPSYKGKIFKTIDSIISNELGILVDKKETLNIHIIFYVATESAMRLLRERIQEWKDVKKENFNFTVEAIQILEDDIKEKVLKDVDFMNIAKKYFDNSIVDDHFKKAKHNNPFLGYNECALPLILVHNTPNNSLPILWLPVDKVTVGLLPRITRHK